MEAGPLVTFLWAMLRTWRLTAGGGRLVSNDPADRTGRRARGGRSPVRRKRSAVAARLACASVSELASCAVPRCRGAARPAQWTGTRPAARRGDHDLLLGYRDFNVGW
ncbi:hypothetical protein EYF80_060984 [Liparis tanakae]|uniref:Uncharacterized protein n=1 Tax=Liparis tanakae TaxID=230148 RepID=A0A4Z2EJ92_9TELE|nr:hypothetical protein EYF80_060984 [Liparis tanakae]